MSGDSRGRPLLNVRCGVCRDWLYEIDGEGATMCIPCRRAYEAGRLAAVRADVADFVGWLERDIARDVVLAAESRVREATEAKRGREYEETRFLHESIMIRADRRIADYSGKVADCRRWLETTQ